MRAYFGYPNSSFRGETFKLKDLFLREVSVDYHSVPVEVKKKLLSMLESVEKTKYLFIGDVVYDGIDLLEFALFSLEPTDLSELILPGYLYGKPTFLIRELFKNTFGKKVKIYYDFNLFSPNTLVLNVGYTKTSVSFGGELLLMLPLGEFHLIDFFGNYLFNRFVADSGVSNSQLRKEGLRGEVLDQCRRSGARILFGRTTEVEVPLFNYRRKVSPVEVELSLTPVVGQSQFGDLIERPFDFSSAMVYALYRFEELFRERFKPERVAVIGRLAWPFAAAAEKLFPVPTAYFEGPELADKEVENGSFRPQIQNLSFPNRVPRALFQVPPAEEATVEALRLAFRHRDWKGLKIIEQLAEKVKGQELERFVYELLGIMKRSSFRTKLEIAYLNYAISALCHLKEIPPSLFKKVVKELERLAYNWLLPFETKMNLLFFCHTYKDRLKDSTLYYFPPLMLTFVRDKKITEGEKNFVRTVAEEFYGSSL